MPADGVVREGDGTMTAWVTTDRRHFSQRVIKTGLRSRRPSSDSRWFETWEDRWLAMEQCFSATCCKLHQQIRRMFKSLIAFCLSRRAIVVVGSCLRSPALLRSGNSTSRRIPIQRLSSWKSPHRRRAFPQKRWNVTTRALWRLASTRRPALTSSAPLPSTGFPLFASRSSTAWTIISRMPRHRSRCRRMLVYRAIWFPQSKPTALLGRFIVIKSLAPRISVSRICAPFRIGL